MTKCKLIIHKGPGWGNTPPTIEMIGDDNPHYRKCDKTYDDEECNLSHIVLFPERSYTEAVPACSRTDKEGMAYCMGAWALYHEFKAGSAEKVADKAIELFVGGCLSTAIILTYMQSKPLAVGNNIVAVGLTYEYIFAAIERKFGNSAYLNSLITGKNHYLYIGK